MEWGKPVVQVSAEDQAQCLSSTVSNHEGSGLWCIAVAGGGRPLSCPLPSPRLTCVGRVETFVSVRKVAVTPEEEVGWEAG